MFLQVDRHLLKDLKLTLQSWIEVFKSQIWSYYRIQKQQQKITFNIWGKDFWGNFSNTWVLYYLFDIRDKNNQYLLYFLAFNNWLVITLIFNYFKHSFYLAEPSCQNFSLSCFYKCLCFYALKLLIKICYGQPASEESQDEDSPFDKNNL